MSYQTFFVLSLLNFCSIFQSKQKTVFGVDNRNSVGTPTSDGIVISYPYNTVTRVVTPSGICSGALVSRCLLLTNFHCISDSNGLKGPISVQVGYTDGKAVKIGNAIYAWWSQEIKPKQSYAEFIDKDWALLKIDSCPGDTVGWFGTAVVKGLDIDVSIIGYANDVNKSDKMISAPCKLKGKEFNQDRSKFLFEHDCDVSPGTSGAPIKLNYQGTEFIVGLQTGEAIRDNNQRYDNGTEYNSDNANVAVPVSSFQGVLTALLENDKSL